MRPNVLSIPSRSRAAVSGGLRWLRLAAAAWMLCGLQGMLPAGASAALVYGDDSVLDTATGLRWWSTTLSLGQSAPAIPEDRTLPGGSRVATAEEVEALFTSHFPALAAVVGTPGLVAKDPDVLRLIEALGGGLAVSPLILNGQPTEIRRHFLHGWAAKRTWRTSLFEPSRWVYDPGLVIYGTDCATPCDVEGPYYFFPPSGQIGSGRDALTATDTATLGIFLVSSVPEPRTSLLALAGIALVVGIARARRAGHGIACH